MSNSIINFIMPFRQSKQQCATALLPEHNTKNTKIKVKSVPAGSTFLVIFRYKVDNTHADKNVHEGGAAIVNNETLEQIAIARQLKNNLINYYKKREQRYKPIILNKYAKNLTVREDVIENGIDWLIHCYRFDKGDTLIDRFIKKHKALSKLEIQILEQWKYSYEGLFEVKAIKDGLVKLFNLIDEKEYTAAYLTGPETVNRLKPGALITSRLIPLFDIYLFSGNMYILPSRDKKVLQELASRIILSGLPTDMAKAWEIQKKYRDSFISYFGDDLIILPGRELNQNFDSFNQFHIGKILTNVPEEEKSKYDNSPPKMQFPDTLTQSKSVGLIFDEKEGLNFYPNFTTFMAPFKNPQLLEQDEYREVIMGYLESESISTLPFRKMVERHPENFRQVFAVLFNKPDWDNDKDYIELMEKYKKAFLKKKWSPTTLPFIV